MTSDPPASNADVAEKRTIVSCHPDEIRDRSYAAHQLRANGVRDSHEQAFALPIEEVRALAEQWQGRATVPVKPQPLTRPQRTYLVARGLLTVPPSSLPLLRRIRGGLASRRRSGRRPTLTLAAHGPPDRPGDDDRPRIAPSRLERLLALLRRRP